ncbi:MAG: archaeosortase/exosortase family protein [Planctomycetota bacterium]
MNLFRAETNPLADDGSGRRLGILCGIALFAPLIPAATRYLASSHLQFAPWGASRVLWCGYVLVLLFTFPPGIPRSRGALALVWGAAGVSAWSGAAGFSAWALLSGMIAMLIWRQSAASRRISETVAAGFILGIILLPSIGYEGVIWFREGSMALVDVLLKGLGVPFHRTGIMYVLGDTTVMIREECSGFSTMRVFAILGAAYCLATRRFLPAWTIVPVVAGLLGLLCNALRIVTHLLWVHLVGSPVGPRLHEGMGIFWFVLILAGVVAVELWRNKPGSEVGMSMESRTPSTRHGWRPVAAAWAGYGVMALAGAWAMMTLPLEKRIEQDYRSEKTILGETVHINRIVEYPGGGGWVLLEHPVEMCLALMGWDVDGARALPGWRGEKIRLVTRYETGGRVFPRRLSAMGWKWADPRLWHQPLRVEVRIVEPGDLRWRLGMKWE